MAKKEETKTMQRNKRLVAMVNAEREKVTAYEQLAKVHSAYIAILLQKLEATKDNALNITPAEVSNAIKNMETRALMQEDGSWGLYCETVGEE